MSDAAGDERSIVVGVGELLWDCFGDERRPGGAPANVAFHAKLLGYRGIVCSRVGTDDLGRELITYVAGHGLDPRYIQIDPAHPTGTVTVDTNRPERPTYVIHENVAWDDLAFTAALGDLMGRAAAVCFGSLAQRSAGSRRTIQQCLEAACRALVVFDVNLRQAWFGREVIEESLRKSHIAKLNVDEVQVLTDMLGTRSSEPVEFGREIAERFGLELICVTRAERGCLLVSGSDVVDVPGRPVQVADGVGAGDAFAAALISGCLRRWSLEKTAAFANEVGGLVASRQGAMPDLGHEYAVLLERYSGGQTGALEQHRGLPEY